MKRIIQTCPICSGELRVGRLQCAQCQSRIDTELPIPPFYRLPEDLQEFVMVFLANRGNIREVEKALGISYPTVCKRLDLVNDLLGQGAAQSGAKGPELTQNEILAKLERGEITAREAAQLLKGRRGSHV